MSDLAEYIRYENVSITIPQSANYIDIPLSYTCNYVRSIISISGDSVVITQAARLESKKVRLYISASDRERNTRLCIGYSII